MADDRAEGVVSLGDSYISGEGGRWQGNQNPTEEGKPDKDEQLYEVSDSNDPYAAYRSEWAAYSDDQEEST